MAASFQSTILQGVTISVASAPPPATTFDISTNPFPNFGSFPQAYSIVRSGDTSGTGSVDWAITSPLPANDGVQGARDADNPFASSGTASFGIGVTIVTVNIDYSFGGGYPSTNSVTLTLSNPVNGSIGTGTATGNWIIS